MCSGLNAAARFILQERKDRRNLRRGESMELAIDFGGTNIKMAAFEKGKKEALWTESILSYSDRGMEQALMRVQEQILQRTQEKPDIMGIALPGIVDSERKRLLTVNKKFKNAEGFDFQEWCSRTFGCPLVMENDANAALLGETAYGCAVGKKNAVMMILGTGIGTAAVIDGRLLRGSHYRAGIMGGHSVIQINGRKCNCGAYGCLEAYAGAAEFTDSVKREPGFVESTLSAEGELTMKSIFAAAEKGDAFAKEQVERLIGYYEAGVLNLVYAYDPECVILSGGIAKGSAALAGRLEKFINGQPWMTGVSVSVLVAENPDFSVTLGLRKRMEDYQG